MISQCSGDCNCYTLLTYARSTKFYNLLRVLESYLSFFCYQKHNHSGNWAAEEDIELRLHILYTVARIHSDVMFKLTRLFFRYNKLNVYFFHQHL